MHTKNIEFGNQKNRIISVIVPVYNSSSYLHKCIHSILNQTYANIELLLIDDGSTDNSSEICYYYQTKDSRVRYLRQDHLGVSAARNLGISKAAGDYITFVDSDDWIDINMYEMMMEKVFDNDAVMCRYVEEINNDNYYLAYEKHLVLLSNRPYNISYFFSDIKDVVSGNTKVLTRLFGSVCRLIIKTEIVRDNGIIFDENIDYSEDLFFLLDCLSKIRRIIILDDYFYHYRIFNDSSSHVKESDDTNECSDFYYKFSRLQNYMSKNEYNNQMIEDVLLLFKTQSILRIVMKIISRNKLKESCTKLHNLFKGYDKQLLISFRDLRLLTVNKYPLKRIVLYTFIKFQWWGLIWMYSNKKKNYYD